MEVQGLLQEYRGALQVKIEKSRLASEEDPYDLMELVPSAPIDLNNAYARVQSLVQSIADSDYQAVCLEILRRHADGFRQMPAAKSVHHSFLGGLLMHTSYMMCMADYLAKLYGTVIQRDLLVAGTLLHDMAKLEEFVTTQTGLVSEYSLKGQLLGHLVMGAQEISEICRELGTPEEKSLLLQHMLLSHHGVPEFGAAVVPQCAEAELLYYIDSIDSRMEIYRENLEKTPVGTFSPRIFALDKKIYHHE